MNFKIITITLLTMSLPASLFAAGSDTDAETANFTGLLRPILFRSEFISPKWSLATWDGWLKGVAKGEQKNFLRLIAYSQKKGYTMQGFKKFPKKAILDTFKISPFDTKLAQSRYYRTDVRKLLAERVRKNPEKYANKLNKETIDAYLKGSNTKAPIGIHGEIYVTHHEHYPEFKLVDKSYHSGTGNDHIGGNSIYGPKSLGKDFYTDRIKLTGQRWAKMAILDMVISNTLLLSQGERDWRTYAVNTAAVAGAGTAAWGIESLLLCSLPLLEGQTPYFFARHLWLCTGGPASWIATAAYIGIQYAVMAGWHKYQLEEKRRVEYMCRTAEQKLLKQTLNNKIKNNDKNLIAISQISANY